MRSHSSEIKGFVNHWFVLSGFQVRWSLEVNSVAVVFLFCVFSVKQTFRARRDALDGIYFGKAIRLWLHSWGPAQKALGNKAVCISGSLQRPGVYPSGPSSSSHRQVLSACVYSLLMYHKFADTVTLESTQAGNQWAALTAREGTDSPRFPQCSLHMEGATRELVHASWGLPAHCRYCM